MKVLHLSCHFLGAAMMATMYKHVQLCTTWTSVDNHGQPCTTIDNYGQLHMCSYVQPWTTMVNHVPGLLFLTCRPDNNGSTIFFGWIKVCS